MAALILSSNDKTRLDAGFAAAFDTAAERYFSAPGRTEVSGNHTDHQRGRVLAGEPGYRGGSSGQWYGCDPGTV